jgi:preprotein translocase SecE subunit
MATANEAREDGKALAQAKGAWQAVAQYASEVKIETKRVTWPGLQEVYGTTVMVVLTTFIFGVYFYLLDLVFSHGVTGLLNSFLHRG